MTRYGISGVPVVDDRGRLLGIITNRDLLFESDPRRLVRDVMTADEDLVTAPAGTTLGEAERLMGEHKIEKLPIVDTDHRLEGRAAAQRVNQAVQHHGMPRRLHDAHQADAQGTDQKSAAQHQPRAAAIGEITGGEHCRRRHDHEQSDGEAKLAAAPAKILDDRLERQTDGKAAAAADEQREKSGGQHEGGAGGDRFTGQFEFYRR